MAEKRVLRNFVDGTWTDPVEGGYTDVVDPSTGEVFAAAPRSGTADVDQAMLAAGRAFDGRRTTTRKDRQLAMLRFADAIEARTGDLLDAECQNTGKPRQLTLEEEMPPAVDHFRFFAGAARVLEGKSAGEYLEGHTSYVRREPIGVCAQGQSGLAGKDQLVLGQPGVDGGHRVLRATRPDKGFRCQIQVSRRIA